MIETRKDKKGTEESDQRWPECHGVCVCVTGTWAVVVDTTGVRGVASSSRASRWREGVGHRGEAKAHAQQP